MGLARRILKRLFWGRARLLFILFVTLEYTAFFKKYAAGPDAVLVAATIDFFIIIFGVFTLILYMLHRWDPWDPWLRLYWVLPAIGVVHALMELLG